MAMTERQLIIGIELIILQPLVLFSKIFFVFVNNHVTYVICYISITVCL